MKIRLLFLAASLLLVPTHAVAITPNTVIATIPVGVNPAGLAITPDNRFAYVADNNNYGMAGWDLTQQDAVSVLDLTNNLLEQTITSTTFNQPYTVTINAAGTKAYVTNSNAQSVTIIDIATNTVIGTITGFDGPSGFAITPDQTRAYVNNYGAPGGLGSGNATTVRVVDLATNLIIGMPIPVGQAPAALAITPDGAYVYVVNYVNGMPNQGTISVIQTSDNTIFTTITVPGFSGPFGIAITSDGKYAYVTNFGSNNFFPFGTTVSVVDIATNTVTATVPVGIQPSGIAITPDDRLTYVTNYDTLYTSTTFSSLVPGAGTINIIDNATNTVIPPVIEVDQSPDAIAISSTGEFAYVSNYTSNTVNVIALQSFQITAQAIQLQNRYLTHIDVVNKITWTVSGTSLPVSYAIYRDAELTELIGTVSAAEPLELFDHNRTLSGADTYYIVGTNRVGVTSVPVAVSVNKNSIL